MRPGVRLRPHARAVDARRLRAHGRRHGCGRCRPGRPDGHGGGSQDKDALEPDKAAFLGTSYLALYDLTHDAKYLDGANAIAKTLAAHQTATEGESRLTIAAKGASIPQLYWVLDEAGKTNIKQLVVETDAAPDPARMPGPWTWF